MKQNIGTVNAMIRITTGLVLLAWSTAKMAKESPSKIDLTMTFVGAMKVAEGMTHYCPMTEVLDLERF